MLRYSGALVLAAFGFLPPTAHAAALTVINVGAPSVNCIFDVTCTEIVTDSIGTFTPPGDAGTARLQTRTSPGNAPAPAGGQMDYEYRIDLTDVTGSNCVNALKVDFGPVIAEYYPPSSTKVDVYVVTSGGLGSVGVATATQLGDSETYFTFGSGGVCPGQTSFFFGLTSAATTPQTGVATVYYSGGGSATTEIRTP